MYTPSEWSITVSATTDSLPAVDSITITSNNISSDSVTIRYEPSSNAAGYMFKVAESEQGLAAAEGIVFDTLGQQIHV